MPRYNILYFYLVCFSLVNLSTYIFSCPIIIWEKEKTCQYHSLQEMRMFSNLLPFSCWFYHDCPWIGKWEMKKFPVFSAIPFCSYFFLKPVLVSVQMKWLILPVCFSCHSISFLFWLHSILLQVHITASECLLEIFKLFGQISPTRPIDVGFKGELLHQYEVEKNGEAKSLLKKCIDVLENLELETVQATWIRTLTGPWPRYLHLTLINLWK